jgi:hypothetical protein
MKKLFLIFGLLVIAFISVATAQNIVTTNQGTYAWNAVTTMADGSAIPAGSVIRYQSWSRSIVEAPTSGVKYGPVIDTTSRTMTFAEGTWFVGVSAERWGGTPSAKLTESAVSWSDVASVCQGGATFGFRHWLLPSMPGGLRVMP